MNFNYNTFSFNSKYTLRKKGTKAVTGAVPFQKGTFLYLKVAYWILP